MSDSTFRRARSCYCFNTSLITESEKAAAFPFLHIHQWILDFVLGARVSDVISPPRSKQKLVYVSLNYLVNMTIHSNLILAAERTLLALQITNQAAAMGRTAMFKCFHDFFEKKIRGF